MAESARLTGIVQRALSGVLKSTLDYQAIGFGGPAGGNGGSFDQILSLREDALPDPAAPTGINLLDPLETENKVIDGFSCFGTVLKLGTVDPDTPYDTTEVTTIITDNLQGGDNSGNNAFTTIQHQEYPFDE